MSVLNDVEKIRSVDPENMYNRIFDLPEQMEEALKISKEWKIDPNDFPEIKNIVVIGMGGSAIGGDLVRSYLSSKLLVPFQVVRNYQLPEYVDDETLVIVSSYSGNTEETLSALDDAIGRKAMIAAISTGGMLEDVCKLNEIPMAKLPEGLQPRAAIGFSFVPTLLFFEKINLVKNLTKEVESAIKLMKTTRGEFIEDNKIDSNPAKNELVGWADAAKALKKNLVVIQLHDSDDHIQIVQRMDIVHKLIAELGIEVIEINAIGVTTLERMFYLIHLGDFVSYYLAVLNNVDPSPVKVINRLKGMLASNKK